MEKKSFDELVHEALKKGPMTTYKIRELGPFHPAGVISRLRKKYPITTRRVTVTDSQGITHKRVALYELKGGSSE